MTYEELVHKVRDVYENADARSVYEHIAVQVNIIGEAAGIFYVEVAERYICVEPYDYRDHDALIVTDAELIVGLADGSVDVEEALKSGRLYLEGDMEKLKILHEKVKLKKRHRLGR